MTALCPSCHARVHRTLRVRWWMSPYLRQLWREQHPRLPEQLPLALADPAAPAPAQLDLYPGEDGVWAPETENRPAAGALLDE